MPLLVTAETVFADGPSAMPQQPQKVEIRRLLRGYEDIINAFTSNGGLIYDTKAHLDADLLHGANSSAWVVSDPTIANNGIYRKLLGSGTGSWTRIADLPYSFIAATDAGAGTPNAIIATTSIPVPAADAAALISFAVFEANAGTPVTVAFNGGSALTIKTASGANIAPGGLVAGMVIAGYKVGATFRLISDQASAAIQAAAEAAQAAAEAARDAAAAAAADAAASAASASGAVPVANRTALKALNVATKKAAIICAEGGRNGTFAFTSGDLSAFVTADALEGIYVAPASAPTGASGAWVRQFTGYAQDIWWGTTHTNVTDDSAALQAAIDVCQAFDLPLSLFPRGNYKLTTGLTIKHGQSNVDTKKYRFVLAGENATLLPASGITALAIVPRCTLADNTTGRGDASMDIENLLINGSSSATAKALVVGAAGMWCSNFTNSRLHNVIATAFTGAGAVSFIECRKWRITSLICRSAPLLIQASTAGSLVGDLEFDFLEVTGSTVALPGMRINASVASGLAQARGIVFNRAIFYASGYNISSGVGGLVGDIWFNATQWDSGVSGAGNIALNVTASGGGKMNGIHFDQPYIVNYTAEAIKMQATAIGDITDVNIIGGQFGMITCDAGGFNAVLVFINIKGYRVIGCGFTTITSGGLSSYIRNYGSSDFVISGNTGTDAVSMTRGVQIENSCTNYRVFGNDLDATAQVLDTDLAASRHVFGNRGDPYLAAAEGTATPTVVGTTTAGAGTYSGQTYVWWRLGKLVFFRARLIWSAHTGTGNITIVPGTGGPPIAAVDTPVSINYDGLTYTSPPQAYVASASNTIVLQMAATNAAAAGLPIEAAASVTISGCYLTS